MPQPNALIHTTSPYLLQHAYNPIHWYPWNQTALAKAQQEDKPILLSIGYSACHWCHVMAKETFENEAVAAMMNQYFICIKVDREERPDIDQVYIAALQAMGLQVGWPLHVFLLPNQQPFYGGTYFPTPVWKQLLTNIAKAFQTHRADLAASAAQFTQALQNAVINPALVAQNNPIFNPSFIKLIFEQIYAHLDHERGGTQGVPKFPMPVLHAFLLDYYHLTKDEKALDQLMLTLQHLAYGGIYDQLGGGFARYATDENWHIPHFEKMLYDNAQLISLYAQAYLTTHQPLYQAVIEQTIDCITQEMMDENGAFYSALAADTAGVEGKFYTWTQQEIEQVLGQDAPLVSQYFNITPAGNWEKGYNILYRNLDEADQIPARNQQSTQNKLQQAKITLFNHRNQRLKPALDDKILASWNGMMIQALIDAYYALDNPYYLAAAQKNACFIQKQLIQNTALWHSYRKGQLGATGYLEDYAWVIKAWISLYQASFEETWLTQAYALTKHVKAHYEEGKNGLFCFTDQQNHDLIGRPQELWDQVIPSANAVMAHNLLNLGLLRADENLINQSKTMLAHIMPLLQENPLYAGHWASLCIKQLQETPIVAIVGPECLSWAGIIKQKYHDVLVLGTSQSSHLPLLVDKQPVNGKTTIYICAGKTCQAPVNSLEVALQQLNDRP